MKVFGYFLITIILLISVGCSPNNDKNENIIKENTNEKSMSQQQSTNNKIYATIGGEQITKEEINYECFRTELQQALTNTAVQKPCPEEETIITQIVQFKAINYIADEKGVTASEEEVQQRIDNLKKELSTSSTFHEKIKSYGEDKFWQFEEKRYYTIINSEKIKENIIDQEKEKHSYYDEESLKLTAKKEFDDLVVEAVGLIDVNIRTE